MLLVILLSSVLVMILLRTLLHMDRIQEQITAYANLQQRGRYFSFYITRHYPVSAAEQVSIKQIVNMTRWHRNGGLTLCSYIKNTKQHRTCAHYFIAKSTRIDQQQQRISAIYVKNASKRRQQLAVGAVQLRLRYWVLDHHHLVAYPESEIKNWQTVKLVEIILLWRSLVRVPFPNHYYWILGHYYRNHSSYLLQPWVYYVKI